MHRWFRFCAVIALVVFIHPSHAQEGVSQNGTSEVAEGITTVKPPEPATPSGPKISKHNLRPTQFQIIEHQIDLLKQKLDQQGQVIADQNRQISEQSDAQMRQLAKLNEENKAEIAQLRASVAQLTQVLQQSLKTGAKTNLPEVSTNSRVNLGPEASQRQVAGVSMEDSKNEPVTTAIVPEAVPAGPVHVIKKGENLTSIARQYGITVAELLNLNKISDERKLRIGQTLSLPDKPSPETEISPQNQPQKIR